jgi:hypothetical protein
VPATQGIHILRTFLPFTQTILTTAPVRFSRWLAALGQALVGLVVMEIYKWVKRPQEVAF